MFRRSIRGMLANRYEGVYTRLMYESLIFLDKISTDCFRTIFFRRGERIAVITCFWNIINLFREEGLTALR